MQRRIKNVTDSVKLAAWTILGKDLPAETKALMTDYLGFLRADNQDKAKESKDKLLQSLPKFATEELSKLQVELPTDIIEVHMSLGNILYDLWAQTSQTPQAPLALELHKRKMSNYAATLDKEEFELPLEVQKSAQAILEVDDKWDKVSGTAWVYVKKEDSTEPLKQYLTIGSRGISIFPKIINGLVSATIPDDMV